MSYLTKWQITMDEIDELITDNPSLRSFMGGYAAELKCRNIWFSNDLVSNVIKHNDHDRTKKGDIALDYKGYTFTVEVKSLQTSSVREKKGIRSAKFQCDASDKRPVVCQDGSIVSTTSLRVGEFDLVAVNLFAFYGEWKFAFAKNTDLPRTSSKKLAPEQREHFLMTSMPITDPPAKPYRLEPWSLLDELVEERKTNVTTE